MDLKTLMKTKPEQLAELQLKEYKEYILNIFNEISNHIRNNRYDEIKKYLFDSPAGDGYGLDNKCIDFSFDINENMDISEAMDRLEHLKKISKSK